MWDARPGMKVICVAGVPARAGRKDMREIYTGNLYTLRDVKEAWDGEKMSPCCTLVEIINPKQNLTVGPNYETDFDEPLYALRRFRPLNKNFSIFEEILRTPIPKIKIKETV